MPFMIRQKGVVSSEKMMKYRVMTATLLAYSPDRLMINGKSEQIAKNKSRQF